MPLFFFDLDACPMTTPTEQIEELLKTVVIAEWPKGTKVLLTPYNRVSPGHYHDPTRRVVLQTNDRNVVVSATAAGPPDDDTTPRPALQSLLDTYCAEHYPNGVGKVFTRSVPGAPFQAAIVIAADMIRGRAWRGQWVGVHAVDFEGVGAASMTSSIAVRVVYTEDAALTLDIAHQDSAPITSKDETTLLAAILGTVRRADAALHAALEDRGGPASRLRDIRRQLPLSKQPFDFRAGQNILLPALAEATDAKDHPD